MYAYLIKFPFSGSVSLDNPNTDFKIKCLENRIFKDEFSGTGSMISRTDSLIRIKMLKTLITLFPVVNRVLT